MSYTIPVTKPHERNEKFPKINFLKIPRWFTTDKNMLWLTTDSIELCGLERAFVNTLYDVQMSLLQKQKRSWLT